jgi:hypothetical protein
MEIGMMMPKFGLKLFKTAAARQAPKCIYLYAQQNKNAALRLSLTVEML